ncbi:dermonecrotic toxin LdSicTox-alphaIB3b-like [Argiope bruennichi]|nr:dermonecrotic toxin LdSicTox-alphaIB3b-like [Argiope bruennichi]XP_055943276.1 dermonecrotic toxin LdSicTox-alphaIB3b-like [Argiope bruennichi]XP_055943277.1 dermonecrotic toxin LdSicTox-alphaIB3b-like [Argiope bruennichi]XP_055943278.1 dermonecrotic toxin LdSicTox-alphaIB3b-like [Argiope bruennichi]
MKFNISLAYILLTTFFKQNVLGERRPFYIIAHMVNELRQVEHYLDRGANALESDVQFHSDGKVKEIYHGFPCDCFRTCHKSAKLSDYLTHVREVTDPNKPNSYYERMVLQFLDLKLSSSNNKEESGRDLARHVLDYLWSKDRNRKQEVKVVVYADDSGAKDVFAGFLKEFRDRGEEGRLKDVGFDGGMGNLYQIRDMFKELGVGNVWQGDGRTNCVSAFYPDGRLRRAVVIRDSKSSFINKVYHWTIDLKLRMRLSLNLGVDGMITNDPEDLLDVIQESYYAQSYRLATVDDNPFEKFEDN